MNKLKTLKDFEGKITSAEMHKFYNELKAEAIKWARLFKTGEFGRRSWELGFLLFFNLSEDDLE